MINISHHPIPHWFPKNFLFYLLNMEIDFPTNQIVDERTINIIFKKLFDSAMFNANALVKKLCVGVSWQFIIYDLKILRVGPDSTKQTHAIIKVSPCLNPIIWEK